MKKDHKHTYTLCANIVLTSTVTDIVIMQTLEVLSDKINVINIST
jgi:hypothetical protein